MCGIAGIVSLRSGNQLLAEAALRLLRHRGPDDHGWLLSSAHDLRLGRGTPPDGDHEVLFLHRRLSILDLSEGGWQPMVSPDGRFALVLNGEIYNFIELRRELESLGHVIHSHSDTEVLLHAFARWGAGCLNRLTGMFAFAMLDRQERRLWLVRDFFGIKPLYYAFSPEGLIFASEIKALFTLGRLPRRVNPQRVYDYLTGGLTDHSGDTLFEGVHQVLPGHYLVVDLDAPALARHVQYWRMELERPLDISYQEASRELRKLFLDSVRLHLRSDVPVGAALSGGIDSSAIVGAMRRLEPGLDLHVFSYVAGSPELSEEKWIDLAAQHAGATLHKVSAGPADLISDLDQLIYQQDEPFGSTSIFVQHRVFRSAQEHGITVMLDGQGADEMLGGYRIYQSARLASLVRQGKWLEAFRFAARACRLPGVAPSSLLLQAIGALVPGRLKLISKQFLQKSVMPAWLNQEWFARRWVRPTAIVTEPGADVLRALLHRTLIKTSLPMLLRYEDRNSMAHSIESRVPFLTPHLAEFLLRLPEQYLIGPDGCSKRIFRDAMRDIVPDPILQRRDKIGFATPERQWLHDLRPWVEQTLRSDAAHAIPAFHHRQLSQDWNHLLGARRFDSRAWRWLNLIRWAERFDVSFAA